MVKMPTKGRPVTQGSFGLPPQAKDLLERKESDDRLKDLTQEQHKYSAPVNQGSSEPAATEDDGFNLPKEVEDPVKQPDIEDDDPSLTDLDSPVNRMKHIGIELTEDDVHQYLFKGFLSKKVPIMSGLKKEMTATLKTLTTEECLVVDKMIARAIDSKTPMTREGLDQLRSVYTLAFGVLELAGRPIAKMQANGMLEEYAIAASKTIQALSAGLATKLVKLHLIFTVAMNRLVDDGSSPFLSDA